MRNTTSTTATAPSVVTTDGLSRLSLTTAEAARVLGVAPKTLRNWRSLGSGPAYVELGSRQCVYRPADLDSWLLSKRIGGDL